MTVKMEWNSVFTMISTIVVAWFGYNQYTKNKKTDAKIKQIEEQDKAKNKLRADNSMVIFGVLWDVLYKVGADRVYIVQPHPLGREEMLSIYFEVKSSGVAGMKDRIQNLRISDIGTFSADMAQNTFMVIHDVESEVSNKYAQSLMASSGSENVIVKRLANNDYKWIGSIFCEFLEPTEINEELTQKTLYEAALKVQYILPEFKN
jgi:hypothetical protein